MRHIHILLSVALLGAACGSPENPAGIPDHCNPLGGTHCAFPFPSSAWLTEDTTTATGYRVDLPIDAMPLNATGVAVDPASWNTYDGFGPSGVILAAFPNGVSSENLPTHPDADAYLGPDAPVVLIDLETGDRVPIFAEADLNADEAVNQALLIHPLVRLQPGRRYGVAVRNTVTDSAGAPLKPTAGFKKAMAGGSSSHPRYAAATEHLDEVLSAVEAQGIDPAQLVLAWDFVTASDEFLTSDLLSMRDQAATYLDANIGSVTFELTQKDQNPTQVYRLYHGSFAAPNFLTSGENPGSVINRDAAGAPVLDGTFDSPVSIVVPKCVETQPLPRPVMVFGHGLFGSAHDYMESSTLQQIADDECLIIVATDWIGLTERQVVAVLNTANDLNNTNGVSEKLGQAVIDFMTLEYLMRGPLADAPELQYMGNPVADTNEVYYFGASLGGIMGGVFMAYDPNITRGVLGVPAGSWSLMLERSFAWDTLQATAKNAYEDEYDYEFGVALLALSLERFDPITTSARVLDDPLPNTPAKNLLLYEALHDSLVTNVATETLARSMGLSVLTPSVRVPFELDTATAPLANGLTIYDEGVTGSDGLTNEPPPVNNGTHSAVNTRPAVIEQMRTFLLTGEVVNTCRDGNDNPVPCDCTTGACD